MKLMIAVPIYGDVRPEFMHSMIALIERLKDAGVPHRIVCAPNVGEVVTANSMLLNAVRERKVTHMGQPALNDSATRCSRRAIGNDGGWGFKGTADVDPTLVEACALAHWAALNKSTPKRKALIG